VWNAFYGLAAQIENTSKEELTTIKAYAEMMPFPPPADHFGGGLLQELLSGTPGNR